MGKMLAECSAGLLEAAGGPGCSMPRICTCFLPTLDVLEVKAHHNLMFILLMREREESA